MADSSVAERTVEQIARASAADVIRAALAAPTPSQSDSELVGAWLSESQRHPRRAIGRTLGDVQRATTIGNAVVADITAASVNLGQRQPSRAPSPWPTEVAAAAPLWAALGHVVTSPDSVAAIEWPDGDAGGTVFDAPDAKVALPSAELQVGFTDDPVVATSGIVIDLSGAATEMLRATGRLGIVTDWLVFAAYTAADKALADAIVAAASDEADLAAALDGLAAPYTPDVLAGSLGVMSTIDLVRLNGLITFAADRHLTGAYVIGRSGIEADRTEVQLLARVEPERMGTVMSASVRHSIVVQPGAVATVAP